MSIEFRNGCTGKNWLFALLAALHGCGEAPAEGSYEHATEPLRGGAVITGAPGVVDFFLASGYGTVEPGGACTGSMIAPNVVLTAAHCLDSLGATTRSGGSNGFTIRYYDPKAGLRVVFSGTASWYVYPTYDGVGPTGPGGSNDDIAIIKTPRTFTDTSYRDYLRIYSDVGSSLMTNLTAYGAGIYSYSGSSDNRVRTTWFEVESVEAHHIVVDTRDLVSVCKGDSGGPLVYSVSLVGKSLPTIAGVASKAEADSGNEGKFCANNDPPHDDAYYCRSNWTHMQWATTAAGMACNLHTAGSRDYRRCFSLPLVEDVDGEGFGRGQGTAIAMSFM